MTTPRSVRIAIVIGLGAALTTLPALPAVAQEAPPTVELADTATLVARGAAVLVEVTATCPAGEPAYVAVAVYQRRGTRTAGYFGQTDLFTCTGEPQTFTVAAVPGGDYAATLKQGVAFAEASLSVCGVSLCGVVSDAEEITIVQPKDAAAA